MGVELGRVQFGRTISIGATLAYDAVTMCCKHRIGHSNGSLYKFELSWRTLYFFSYLMLFFLLLTTNVLFDESLRGFQTAENGRPNLYL